MRTRASAAIWAGLLLVARSAPAAWQPPPPPPDDAIYFVLVDRFANGDPTNDGDIDPEDPQAWHGGDIQGVIDHLDELQTLGVRSIWLSPVFDTRTDKFFEWGAFHGYWVEDYARIDARFGTPDDLRRLADELHARDMRLLLDVVFNHVAMDAQLTREKPGWFHPTCDIVDWNDPHQLTDCRVHGLPDLAQENEEVYQYLLHTSIDWIDRVHADGFRIDAVRHMPNAFLARFAADIRAHAGPGFLLLGEDFQGDALGLSRTFREGDFGALFDFPLHYAMLDVFCHGRSVGRIAAVLSADRDYDNPARLVPFLDNHDLPRLPSACDGRAEDVEHALTVLLTTRGIPSITYGTEAGLTGAEEPANRADMVFGADHSRADHIRRLLALRSSRPALHSGGTRLLALQGDLLVYARTTAAQAILVAINRGDRMVEWPVPPQWRTGTPPRDLLTDRTLDEGSVSVPARGIRVVEMPPLEPAGPAPTKERVIRVQVRGAPQIPDGELVVVGTGPRLGNWDPASGIGPAQSDESGLEVEFTHPVGDVLEFKVVIRHADGAVTWQPGENRYLLVESGDDPESVQLAW